jgi:hypothetical protein
MRAFSRAARPVESVVDFIKLDSKHGRRQGETQFIPTALREPVDIHGCLWKSAAICEFHNCREGRREKSEGEFKNRLSVISMG